MSAGVFQLGERARGLAPGVAPSLLRGLGPFVACVVIAALLQMFVKPMLGAYSAKLVLDIGVNIILAVSLTMVNGFTGQFSMGHAGFMAVGGYTAGVVSYYGSLKVFGSAAAAGGMLSGMPIRAPEGVALLSQGDLLFVCSLLVGGLVSALLGFLVGLPSLRLRGDYLAIVTLGFGEIVRVTITQTGPVLAPMKLAAPGHALTGQMVVNLAGGSSEPRYAAVGDVPWTSAITGMGGALGFSGLPTYTSLFWVFLFAFVTLLVAYRLKKGTFGRAFLSIREDEIASEAMGVNTTRYKVWAFVIAAFFAGIAGGLFAHTLGVGLSPQAAGFQKSFDIIIMVVLGGLGSISGATIAAVVVTLLPEYLRDVKVGAVAVAWVGAGVLGVVGIFSVGSALFAKRTIKPQHWISLGLAGMCVVIAIAIQALNPSWALATVQLGNFRMAIFALALILMMIFRPQGLLGVRELWDKALWRDARSLFTRRKAVPRG